MPSVKVWEGVDGIEDETAEEPTLSSSSGYYNIFSFYIVGVRGQLLSSKTLNIITALPNKKNPYKNLNKI